MEPSKRDCMQLNLWQKTYKLYVNCSIGRGDLLENSEKKNQNNGMKKKKSIQWSLRTARLGFWMTSGLFHRKRPNGFYDSRGVTPEIYVCTCFVLWVYLEEGDYIQFGRCSGRVYRSSSKNTLISNDACLAIKMYFISITGVCKYDSSIQFFHLNGNLLLLLLNCVLPLTCHIWSLYMILTIVSIISFIGNNL